MTQSLAHGDQVGNRRFIIIGLPRSGTTYLMTLLNSHQDVSCAGELFNPYSIVAHEGPDYDPAKVFQRDHAPRYFLDQFFKEQEAGSAARIGFKLMLGHNLRVLTYLQEMPDVPLIYVWRNNRLAQVASFLKAVQTKNWAQTRRSADMSKRIVATPQTISHYWHEYATMDFLFEQWVKTLPNPQFKVEYRDLFKPGFNAQVCDFLGIGLDRKMKSPLVKQGANRVLDRFENPGPIDAYIKRVGRESWLETELN